MSRSTTFPILMAVILAPVLTAHAQDATVQVVAVTTPTQAATTRTLPRSIEFATVGDAYFVEVWATDTSANEAGLSSVYVDLLWPELLAAAKSPVDHGPTYRVFRSGDIGPGIVDELGGSTIQKIGVAPDWALVAIIKINAIAAGETTYTMVPSNLGMALRGVGGIPWSRVTLVPVSVVHRCLSDSGCNDGNSCTIDTCVSEACVFTPSEFDPPFVVHGDGLKGETRPFTGYVDPRSESSNGLTFDRGLRDITIVFSEVVRGRGGTPLSPASFEIATTGGPVPQIATVDASNNPTVRITLATSPPIREWTTVRADVEDLCGNAIINKGNQGVGASEPDRVDFLSLPGDTDQNGGVQPLDLLRYRQIILGSFSPPQGLNLDYVDTDRSGTVNPIDLLRFRQLLSGVGPATTDWLGQTANQSQP